MRARRKSQSSATIRDKSETIALSISSKLRGSAIDLVGCYRAQDGEVDLGTVIHSFFSSHIRVVLPVVCGLDMRFTLINQDTEFVLGKFGIEEPAELDFVDPWEIELVLAPLVAFSSLGYRLGRGGGYYDRVFYDNIHTVLVGVGYDFQHTDEFLTHTDDRPLDAVVTESGWRMFRTNKLLSDLEV